MRLAEFNWGAFFLTWIWALGNKSFNIVTFVLLMLCLVPYLGLGFAVALAVYSGMTGNRRAKQNRSWDNTEHFTRVQRRWAIVGATQFAVVILGLIGMSLMYDK